jgi:laccase
VLEVEEGAAYLLRLVNAAMNFHVYVGVAGHELTLVNADAEYTEALTRGVIVLAPGQTSDVLLRADIGADIRAAGYLLAAAPYSPANPAAVPYPAVPATAVIRYKQSSGAAADFPSLPLPSFPLFNDSLFVANFTQSLRGDPTTTTATAAAPVPSSVDDDLFFTVGYALNACANCTFRPFPGLRLSASFSNVTFVDPSGLSLQAIDF